ncbi:MAG: C40 family peptidase [Thermoleophilia bacterium]
MSGSTTTTTTTAPPGPSEETLRRLRELEALSSQISAKQYLVYKAAIELDEIDRVLANTVEDYNLRVLELEDTKQEAERLQRELELVREELSAAEQALQQRVVGAYKNDNSALDFLLSTTDISDFIRRLGLLISIVRNDQRRVDEVGSLRARSDRLLDDASRQIYDVTTASRLLEEQKAQIEAKLAERQAYLDRLSDEVRALVDQQRKIAADVVPVGFDVGSYMVGDVNAIVKTALRYLGIPYVWGGATPSGFDCSGLVQYVFMQHGLYLPHYSRYQAQMGFEVPLEDIAPADLVFFGDPVYHVGMYIGDGLFIHAPRTGDVVKISPLAERTNLSHIRRVAVLQPLDGLLAP